MSSPTPQLAAGAPSTFSALTETFSFHASPESFISSRVLAIHAKNPNIAKSRCPIRALVLGRNVAVLSSHVQVSHVLQKGQELSEQENTPKETYIAKDAYSQFMAPFFPGPNCLLSQGREHEEMRERWKKTINVFLSPKDGEELIRKRTRYLARQHFLALCNQNDVDLYAEMKKLVWKILLGIFLDLKDDDKEFFEVVKLQEELLRGQFSTFPVSVNVPWFWKSARTKGIHAADKLVNMLGRMEKKESCPFSKKNTKEDTEVARHLLLFTSSLATKAMASLGSAFVLNASRYAGENPEEHELRRILLETERLSPPIVGIMRRATQENTLPPLAIGQADTLIPSGWDAWLYFVGVGRDYEVFGPDAEIFSHARHDQEKISNAADGVAFGTGKKNCLGKTLVRNLLIYIAQEIVEDKIIIHVRDENLPLGVKGWLGWAKAAPDHWARDMRQLPTQHPVKPLLVSINTLG